MPEECRLDYHWRSVVLARSRAMPRSARAPSRLGGSAGAGTEDRAEGLTEPLLDADDVSTPDARFSGRSASGGGNNERTPPNTTARRAGLGIPPSPTPEEWSALRRDLRVRHGELYVTPVTSARPTTSSGVPLLRGASLFRSISHRGDASRGGADGAFFAQKRGVGFGSDDSSHSSHDAARDAYGDDAPRGGLSFPETTAGNGDAGEDATRSADDHRRRVALAAEYVRDALDGSTHLTFRRESRFARSIAKAQRTFLYLLVLRTTLLLNLCLVFFEPTTRHSGFNKRGRLATLAAELAFAGFFALTALADLARLGFERYRAKHWRFVFAFGAVALFVDACVALAAVSFFDGTRDGTIFLARPTRCLRPLLVIAHFRPTRRLVSSAAKTLPKLQSTVRLIGVLIVAWSTLGVQLYQGAYDVEDVDDRGNFDNAFDGAVAMTVLLTTENFPDVMRPSLGHVATHVNGVPKPVSAVFFVSFIVLGVWLGMSLWTSVIFETYKQQHRRKVRGARAHEQKALIAAYSVLQDSPADEPLPIETWIAVAKKARPSLREEQLKALFATLDKNGDGKIDVDEFLNTCDVLRARVSRAPTLFFFDDDFPASSLDVESVPDANAIDRDRSYSIDREPGRVVAFRTNATRHAVGSLVRSAAFARASRAMAFFQAAVVCARRRGASAETDATIDFLDALCVFFLVSEIGARVLAVCLKADGEPRRTTDGTFVCVSSGARGFVAEHGFDFFIAVVSAFSFLPLPFFFFHKTRLFRVVAPFRTLRLASTDPAVRKIVSTFARCARVIGTLLAVLFCVVYMYACVGLELFGANVTTTRGYCVSGDETGDVDGSFAKEKNVSSGSETPSEAPCLDRIENFEAPWNAFLALFQVVTSNNWHDILYPNAAAIKMRGGDAGEMARVVAVFYFVSFYFVTVLLLVNILTSLVLEMFGITWFKERQDEEEREGMFLREGERGDEGAPYGYPVSDGDERDDGDGTSETNDAAPGSSTAVIREVVSVDGVAFEVTRARDFDRDVLLADGGGDASERAALVKQLEQVERQIARRRHERVAEIVRAMNRGRRRRNENGGGSDAVALDGDGSENGFRNRFRFRATEPDLASELDALDDDDRARVAEILRGGA